MLGSIIQNDGQGGLYKPLAGPMENLMGSLDRERLHLL